MPDPISFSFALPFEAAIAAARARKVVLPEDYYGRVPGEMKRVATTISGLAGLDQVQAVIDSVHAASASGQSFGEWKRMAELRGWKLPPGRLETIFRTNVQTAYSQGHWRSFQANKARRPYLMYSAINDSRVRPTHLKMDGQIAPVDDPLWRSWTPPCGFNCRCSQIQLTEQQARDRGYGKQERPDVKPDPGFGGFDPAGEGAALERPWAEARAGAGPKFGEVVRELDARRPVLHDEVGRADVATPLPDQPTWREVGRPDLRRVTNDARLPDPGLLDRAPTRIAAFEQLAAVLGVSEAAPTISVNTPIETAIIQLRDLPHMVEKPEDARERYARFILPTLQSPFEVWAVKYNDGGVRNHYIGLFRGSKDLLVSVKVNLDGSIVWNVIQAVDKKMNRPRLGQIIFQK